MAKALKGLASGELGKEWYVLEGPSYPDAFIETPDALIVIEGKFTETGATTKTTWMPKRHQMLRHLDAAWEIRGQRSVYGLFIVESETPTQSDVPAKWSSIAASTTGEDALLTSLPHRKDSNERRQIAESFIGITTWQAIQKEFGLDASLLRPRQ